MYDIILAVVAPINSNNAPRLQVVSDIAIVTKTRTVVMMKCNFVDKATGSMFSFGCVCINVANTSRSTNISNGKVVSMLKPKQSLATLISVSSTGKLFKMLPFVFSPKTPNPE